MVKPRDMVVSLYDVDHDDKYFVGEHAAHMGRLANRDLSVLPGFVVTSAAYFEFLSHNNLNIKIKHLLGAINYDNDASISQISQYIKKLIKTSKIPDHLVKEISSHYEKIGGSDFSIKTSIVSGDHEQPKFHEEKEVHNIAGDAVLLDSVRSFWAALFTPALIIHRNKNNIHHLKSGIAATVQKAIKSNISGKIKLSDDKSQVIIELPSGYDIVINKKTYEVNVNRLLDKPTVFVADNKIVEAFDNIAEAEAIILAKMAEKIEESFYFPQEISWVKDNNKFYITGIRTI